MSDYLVIFDYSPLSSSDAAVGTKPTPASEITADVQTAKIAHVSAEDEASAQQAVEVAYNSSVQTPIVIAR